MCVFALDLENSNFHPGCPFSEWKIGRCFFPKGETLDSATRDTHLLLVSLWFSFSAISKLLLSLLRRGNLVLALSISSRNLQGQVYFKNYLWAAQRSGPFCGQVANRSVWYAGGFAALWVQPCIRAHGRGRKENAGQLWSIKMSCFQMFKGQLDIMNAKRNCADKGLYGKSCDSKFFYPTTLCLCWRLIFKWS